MLTTLQGRSISRGLIPNAQPWATGYIGLLVFLALFRKAQHSAFLQTTNGYFVVCAIVFATMAVIDLAVHRVHRQPDVGQLTFRFSRDRLNLPVLGQKMAGLAVSAAIAQALYTGLPIYRDSWFAAVFDSARPAIVIFLVGLLIYVILFHFWRPIPKDSLSNFGQFALTLGATGNREEVKSYLLGLMIKTFFLPLMIGFGGQDWGRLTAVEFQQGGFRSIYEFLYQFWLLIDVSFAVIGYSCSFRLLNAHLRWPEMSIGGWVICLICYAPFWQLINRNYISYSDEIVWGTLFPQDSAGYVVWGALILLLMGTYALSTVSFGYRFSNLTYRGVVTHGPYRVFRHPAYTCKNIAYWMIELPMFGASPATAMMNCLGLVAVNAIYFTRARYEEACCAKHEDYAAYMDTPLFHRVIKRFNSKRPFEIGPEI
ncbi:isoprenylcysteine carboxylmethyltransferase family protein [Nioella nitratireducens]|uniref:isoprenylcysteine carboxylmethyltransferase family protein n=1 Tax=Nioella nitratireducens TaxID=1287720 RepID=UPI000A03A0DE|nr:isoprenylcysteine carboxylmethyltransferase family protein [Nioella nitratireducens]